MSTIIYTDGSSRGNPGPGGWGAVVCDGDRVVELGGREDRTTNNRMELKAVISALEWMQRNSEAKAGIVVRSDSKYVIQGITAWVFGWQRNGWMTAGKKEVENRDLWEDLILATMGLKIEWDRVSGHAGVPGNERCDEIATGFADKDLPSLYDGSAKAYTIDLSVRESAAGSAEKKKKSSSSAKAYSYLSLVGGKLEIHKTWAECEARVKGVKGTRFKKSISAADEREIAKSWGF
jgi:ribonuclease HI